MTEELELLISSDWLCIFIEVFSLCLFVFLLYRYDIPQYGSRRRLISPMYDEYGEVIVEDDYYSITEVFSVLYVMMKMSSF